MSHPYHHAESSARKFGGKPDDYQHVHDWFDASKELTASRAHRLLRHHAQGIFEAERRFGTTLVNSVGRTVPVRFIGEQHVKEDCCGRIPTFGDWVECVTPKPWMLGGKIMDPPSLDGWSENALRAEWRDEVQNDETLLGFFDWLEEKRP